MNLTTFATPSTTHPLLGLVAATSYDSGLQPGLFTSIYALLNTAGLPPSSVVVEPNDIAVGGIALIGPNGNVPFRPVRAIHRVQWGLVQWQGIPGFGYQFGNSGMWTAQVLPNGGPIRAVNNPTYSGEIVSAGSRYFVAPGNEQIALESNSFVSANGTFYNVPGIAGDARYFDAGLLASTQTISEMIPPSAASVITAQPMFGVNSNPIEITTFGTWATAVGGGASLNRRGYGIVTSQYDIDVDSVLVDAVVSQLGKIYAVAQVANPLLALNTTAPSYTTGGGLNVYPDLMVTPLKGGAFAPGLNAAVSITDLVSGTWNEIAGSQTLTVADQVSGASDVAASQLETSIGAGINVAPIDQVIS